ncbi:MULTISPECIES: hypothetical protein [unclassified Methylobacterium]|uniref:hypothetical protein n=1 Tax=unclassified Methylobacterium TaxID=2615210 RepID=UPI0011C1D34F|nr:MULTISPECIES: hypothetical protein [unclassified Methylobacterium]QEE38873.1 hypothetical protein FVA80_07760 [Methylobacterium sp. WL1]TXN00895.1 hypothetical protein FV242_20535 [Methylobacterium sp. WL64]TXN52385.1 hypothetical protein FV241_29500 [Methylobacterium sp. WL2]
MTMALVTPAAQACAFALGCAVIHAARGHAEILTRVLAAAAIVAAFLVLLVASLDAPQGDAGLPDPLPAAAAP